MRPLIYAKTSFSTQNAMCKHKIGCDGLEIQLLDENLDTRFNLEEMYPMSDFERLAVKSIHTPLSYRHNEKNCSTLLENLHDYRTFRDLHRVFQIANHFGKISNEIINIVIHSEHDVKSMDGVWQKICENLLYVISLYPYTKLLIENVTPVEEDKSTIGYHLANNYGFETVETVNKLRNDLRTDRIGAVLDLCHAGITNNQIGRLTIDTHLPNPYTLRNYFREFKDVCGLIHYNWYTGDGSGTGHGTVPTKAKCKMILDLYKEYGYTCPLVLEVREVDYLVCDNYRKAKDMIDSYYNGNL